MKITLSKLSPQTIQAIGGKLIKQDYTSDLTRQLYTFIKDGQQITIAKAIQFDGTDVFELTLGALKDQWSLVIIDLSSQEKKIYEGINEEEICQKIQS